MTAEEKGIEFHKNIEKELSILEQLKKSQYEYNLIMNKMNSILGKAKSTPGNGLLEQIENKYKYKKVAPGWRVARANWEFTDDTLNDKLLTKQEQHNIDLEEVRQIIKE